MFLGTLLPFERVCKGALKRAAMKPKPTFTTMFQRANRVPRETVFHFGYNKAPQISPLSYSSTDSSGSPANRNSNGSTRNSYDGSFLCHTEISCLATHTSSTHYYTTQK